MHTSPRLTRSIPMYKNTYESGERQRAASRGFTLLELIVVMAIIMILAGIAVGRYQQSLRHAHEVALKTDLYIMRDAIQKYAEDKGQWPGSLDDLKTGKYIGDVPTDPFTNQKNWNTITGDCDVLSVDQTSSNGICDVFSSSSETSPFDGTAYNTW
jgi:general secretion pathway protein G